MELKTFLVTVAASDDDNDPPSEANLFYAIQRYLEDAVFEVTALSVEKIEEDEEIEWDSDDDEWTDDDTLELD